MLSVSSFARRSAAHLLALPLVCANLLWHA